MARNFPRFPRMQSNNRNISDALRALNALFAEYRFTEDADGKFGATEWDALSKVWSDVIAEGQTHPDQRAAMGFCVSDLLEKLRDGLALLASQGDRSVLSLTEENLQEIFDRLITSSRDKCWRSIKEAVEQVRNGLNPPVE
jgi:hypothetical protein